MWKYQMVNGVLNICTAEAASCPHQSSGRSRLLSLSLSRHRHRDPCASRREHLFFSEGPIDATTMTFELVLSGFWAVSSLTLGNLEESAKEMGVDIVNNIFLYTPYIVNNIFLHTPC
jgi:hypothetical protein